MKDAKRVFEDIEQCRTVTALDDLLIKYSYEEEAKRYRQKYPEKQIILSKQEIQSLKDAEIISRKTNHINLDKIPVDQPLVKLLISLIWKQGDINHIQHLVGGMLNDEDKSGSKQNLIFRQYGKSLVDTSEPIVDQHVLRAFQLRNVQDEKESLRIKEKTVYKNDDNKVVDAYRKWFQDLLKNVPEAGRPGFRDINLTYCFLS